MGVLDAVLGGVGANLLVGVVVGGPASRWEEEWASMYDTCGHFGCSPESAKQCVEERSVYLVLDDRSGRKSLGRER